MLMKQKFSAKAFADVKATHKHVDEIDFIGWAQTDDDATEKRRWKGLGKLLKAILLPNISQQHVLLTNWGFRIQTKKTQIDLVSKLAFLWHPLFYLIICLTILVTLIFNSRWDRRKYSTLMRRTRRLLVIEWKSLEWERKRPSGFTLSTSKIRSQKFVLKMAKLTLNWDWDHENQYNDLI